MIIKNLGLPRGDDRQYDLAVIDQDSVVLNLTGATVRFTVKEKLSDPDSSAKIRLSSANIAEINVQDPVGGLATIYVKNVHTQNLELFPHVYDVQVTSAAGLVGTVCKGLFAVIGDVTRTV